MRVKYLFSPKKTGKSRKSPTTNKHKIPYPKMVSEVIRTSDVVLEVLDARFIEKTRNKELEKMIREAGKKLIFVLNKADLVDMNEIKMNLDLSDITPYFFFSCKEQIGRKRLRDGIKIEVKKLKIKYKKARVGIIGYPNTGKSSLINILARRKGAGTSPEEGFTKAMRKIRLSRDILILDTPGVIPEKEYSSEVKLANLKKNTEIGAKTYASVKEPEIIVHDFVKNNPGVLEKYYEIDVQEDSEALLEKVGMKKSFLKKGGVVDTQRTARQIIRDLQEGKIKRE